MKMSFKKNKRVQYAAFELIELNEAVNEINVYVSIFTAVGSHVDVAFVNTAYVRDIFNLS